MNNLYYFLANCDRKNQISELVGYLTTACKQALLRNVASGRNLSRAVDVVKFWLLCVQSKRTLSLLKGIL